MDREPSVSDYSERDSSVSRQLAQLESALRKTRLQVNRNRRHGYPREKDGMDLCALIVILAFILAFVLLIVVAVPQTTGQPSLLERLIANFTRQW